MEESIQLDEHDRGRQRQVTLTSQVTLRSIFQWSVAHASVRQVYASLNRSQKS